jgi:hypothetical protein
MASYTVAGHPIGPPAITGFPDDLHNLLQSNGVGQSITITLSGPDDTKAKGHGAVK